MLLSASMLVMKEKRVVHGCPTSIQMVKVYFPTSSSQSPSSEPKVNPILPNLFKRLPSDPDLPNIKQSKTCYSLLPKLNPYEIKIPFHNNICSTVNKESACNAGDLDSIPGSGRSPGEGNGNPLQYSCLENPHGQRSLSGYSTWGLKSQTQLSY